MKKGTLIVYTMNVNEKKKPISIYGGAVFTVLAISVVCAWALFYLTNFKPVALFKTTRYTLTHEIGMSFYDFPGGKEQEVLYWDEAGGEDVSERPEPKPGERWMDFFRLVLHPDFYRSSDNYCSFLCGSLFLFETFARSDGYCGRYCTER